MPHLVLKNSTRAALRYPEDSKGIFHTNELVNAIPLTFSGVTLPTCYSCPATHSWKPSFSEAALNSTFVVPNLDTGQNWRLVIGTVSLYTGTTCSGALVSTHDAAVVINRTPCKLSLGIGLIDPVVIGGNSYYWTAFNFFTFSVSCTGTYANSFVANACATGVNGLKAGYGGTCTVGPFSC